jgi:hypothetical protein
MGAIRLAAVAALALLVAACAPPKVPYDRSEEVRTIGVVTPRFPDGPVVFLASSVGQSFGLIGALIDAGMQADREAKFKAVLDQQKFSTPDVFMQALTGELQARGYTVVVIPMTREGTEFAGKYPVGQEPKVDAYLDLVAYNFGYVAAGIRDAAPYRPIFALKARLVSAKNAALLMQDSIVYNPIRPVAGSAEFVTIAPDPEYGFTNFDALMADPTKALKGLQIATEQSAQTVGKLLQ